MDVAVKNDALFLIPDKITTVSMLTLQVNIIVCGKLDTHASVYSFSKIQAFD